MEWYNNGIKVNSSLHWAASSTITAVKCWGFLWKQSRSLWLPLLVRVQQIMSASIKTFWCIILISFEHILASLVNCVNEKKSQAYTTWIPSIFRMALYYITTTYIRIYTTGWYTYEEEHYNIACSNIYDFNMSIIFMLIYYTVIPYSKKSCIENFAVNKRN